MCGHVISRCSMISYRAKAGMIPQRIIPTMILNATRCNVVLPFSACQQADNDLNIAGLEERRQLVLHRQHLFEQTDDDRLDLGLPESCP